MKNLTLIAIALFSTTSVFANSICTISINGATTTTEEKLNVDSNESPVVMIAGEYRLKIISMRGENDSGKSIWTAVVDAQGEELANNLAVSVGGSRFQSSQMTIKAPNGDRVSASCYISNN